MPSLRLWGFHFAFGSDDVLIPAAMHAITRVALTAQAGLVVAKIDHAPCADHITFLFSVIFKVQLGFAIIGFLLSVVTAWISCQGTILNEQPRKRMGIMLGIDVIFIVCEAALATFGTLSIFYNLRSLQQHGPVCEVHEYYLHVLFWWLLVAWGSYLLECIVLYLCLGETSNDIWQRRLNWVFGSSSAEVIDDIAWMLDRFTVGLDLVPSDIIAGLHLLQLQDADRNVEYEPEAPCPLLLEAVLPEVEYFAKYYMAVYGALLYFYTHPFRCTIGLLRERPCCCGAVPPFPVYGDFQGLNLMALRKVTGLADEDILFVSFLNEFHRPVYYIALDRPRRTIVVAIRGTLSLADTVTDLDATPLAYPVGVAGLETIEMHRGIFTAAQNLYQDLQRHRILARALDQHPDYSLLLTGHSLGAGTATLLGFLLRPTLQRPVRVIAYSPPGGLLSVEGADAAKDFVTSVVFGDDVIPRLGIHPLIDLRERLLRALACCKRHKWGVICGCCHPHVSDLCEEDEEAAMMLDVFRMIRPVDADNTRIVIVESGNELDAASIPRAVRSRSLTLSDVVWLWPPGHILYLQKDGKRFRARWADRQAFRRILITPRMFADHLPDALAAALAAIVAQHAPPEDADDRTPLLSPTSSSL